MRVKLNLAGLDGNAFALIGAFQQQAKKEGWSQEAINAVISECRSGDYNHLLNTLMDNTEETDENLDAFKVLLEDNDEA